MANNSQTNTASLISLTLEDSTSDAISVSLGGAACPGAQCDLSAGEPVEPGESQAGVVNIDVPNPGLDTRLEFGLRLTSVENDYRSSNNRPDIQVFVTDKPDIDLQAPTFVQGVLSANQPQAIINVSIDNLSRHQTANAVTLTMSLPPATQLVNAGTLGCTQTGMIMSCPLGDMPDGASAPRTLRLQSADSISRTVEIEIASDNGTFGLGTTSRSVDVAYPQPEEFTLGQSSSGGSIWLMSIFMLLLRRHGRK